MEPTPQKDRERLPNFIIPAEFTFNGGNGNVRPLIFYPDKRLTMMAERVTAFDQGLADLAADLAMTMYMTGGVGIAAPQVGVLQRLFVCDVYANADLDLPMVRRRNGLIAVVNPQVVSTGGRPFTLTEGCLSFPGVHEPITRPFSVVVTAQNLRGEQAMFESHQWFGRIVMHEIEHLDGGLFVDHLGPTARREVEKKVTKFRKAVMEGPKKK